MNLTLFDLDGTLIPNDSDHAFGEFMVKVGWADGERWRCRNDEFYAQYLKGQLDLQAYIDFATSVWRLKPLAEAQAMRERFMHEVIVPQLHATAHALVQTHRARGDLLAIVTATNEFITRPIADAFGVEHLIAVELERDAGGRATGAIRGVPSYREGKIARVHQWLASLDHRWADFQQTTFYSDSTNDLPLLEHVQQPVATNPGDSLLQIAHERGWRILNLFE